MNPLPLVQPTDAQLSAAVHENLYALLRSMRILPDAGLVENERICYHYALPGNPMFRGVWRPRLAPGEVEQAIDQAIEWFEQRRAPDFIWWTDSHSEPPDLAEHLLRRGFDGNISGEPGMVAELHRLNEEMTGPAGLEISQALDRKTLEDWRDVFCASYNAPSTAGQAWVEAVQSAGPHKSPWKLYTGCLSGRPVAASILFTGAGVAGLYGVGTIPEACRQGIGAAIALIPLLEARQQGYHHAVLFSSRSGFSVYKRLGFREANNRIGMYIKEFSQS
jgi:hypothetical protein